MLSDVIRWLAWWRQEEFEDLMVGDDFVAINAEFCDSFESWKAQNLPWDGENDSHTRVPHNTTVSLWCSVSHCKTASISGSRVVPGVPRHHPKTKSPGITNRAPKLKVS